MKDNKGIPVSITEFINSQKVFSLATVESGKPYCANCYYAFWQDFEMLVFKSNPDSMHVQQGLIEKNVAGTIYKDSDTIVQRKGIQFTGLFISFTKSGLKYANEVYYKRFPFAKMLPGKSWGIQLDYIKMTASSLGLGKKQIWTSIRQQMV